MAITMNQIDALKTLNAFKDFATSTRQGSGTVDSIIHYEQAEGFSVDERDRIRGLLTWSSPHRNVDANNATRNAFKEALLALFDKRDLSELPKAVQKKLKAGDFDGTGKPLSVRRIEDIMTVVADTVEYKNTTEYAAMKAFSAEKLSLDTPQYMALEDRTKPDAGSGRIITNMMKFCENLCSQQYNGGHFHEVIDRIGKGLDTTSLKDEVESFFSGIGKSLMAMLISSKRTAGDFSFRTDHTIGEEKYANLPKMAFLGVENTDNAIRDLDNFFGVFKDYVTTKFRIDNEGADLATVNTAINTILEEVKNHVDQLKMRMSGLQQLEDLPGANAWEKVNNFLGQAMERRALEVE